MLRRVWSVRPSSSDGKASAARTEAAPQAKVPVLGKKTHNPLFYMEKNKMAGTWLRVPVSRSLALSLARSLLVFRCFIVER